MATKKNTNKRIFTFTCEDGTVIKLPHVADEFKAGFFRKNRKTDQEDLSWVMIEQAAGDDLDKVDDLSLDELQSLMEAWMETAPELGK